MNNISKALLLVTSVVASSSVLARNDVRVVLNNNIARDTVFEESDFFSSDALETRTVNESRVGSVSRIYNHGPKHVTFRLRLSPISTVPNPSLTTSESISKVNISECPVLKECKNIERPFTRYIACESLEMTTTHHEAVMNFTMDSKYNLKCTYKGMVKRTK